jgi:hypothetical protein
MRVSKPVFWTWSWFLCMLGLCVGTWGVVALDVVAQIPPPGPTPQQKYASYKLEAEKSALKCGTAKGTAEIKRARAQFNVADYFRLKQHFLDVWTVSGHQLPSQAFFNALLNYEVAMTGHLEDGEGVALTTYGSGYLGGEHHRAAGVSDYNTGVGYAGSGNWSYATSYMTYAKDWYDSGTSCYDASVYPFVQAGDTARTAMFLILQYAQTLDPGFTWQVPN